MLRELLRAGVRRLVGCRHRQLIREKRTLYGAEIWHFVCPTCGHAEPMIRRSESETLALAAREKREAHG